MNTGRVTFIGIIIIFCLAACHLPGIPATPAATPSGNDPHALETSIALSITQTLAAAIPAPPSETPQPSNTPLPTFTFTPDVPMVSVSVNTNCRSGPGTVYEILSALNVGQNAEVVGRSPSGDNWIIHPPNQPAITCWLWGQYATVVGDTSRLPVIQPPPTPTPAANYSVSYTGMSSCGLSFAFRFMITNNGSITWESVQIMITDTTAATSFIHVLDNFRSYNGCPLEMNQQDLTPGESGAVTNVNPGQLGYNPAGHSITANFKLCSQNGLLGQCVEKSITFTP